MLEILGTIHLNYMFCLSVDVLKGQTYSDQIKYVCII